MFNLHNVSFLGSCYYLGIIIWFVSPVNDISSHYTALFLEDIFEMRVLYVVRYAKQLISHHWNCKVILFLSIWKSVAAFTLLFRVRFPLYIAYLALNLCSTIRRTVIFSYLSVRLSGTIIAKFFTLSIDYEIRDLEISWDIFIVECSPGSVLYLRHYNIQN